jgi:hypothetical protein
MSVYPTHLYKYQRLTAHSLASVLNKSVWMASPTSFNDPFDCAIPFPRANIKESMENMLKSAAASKGIDLRDIRNHDKIEGNEERAYEILKRTLQTTLSKAGVLCLSATSLEILMWSHYADNHKGFCIEYDFSEDSGLRKSARPVQYQNEMPDLSVTGTDEEHRTEYIQKCVFTKAKQWKYEQEWRVLHPEGNRAVNASGEITSIIFGARMSITDKQMLALATKHLTNIQLRQAVLCEDRFAVDLVPVTRVERTIQDSERA